MSLQTSTLAPRSPDRPAGPDPRSGPTRRAWRGDPDDPAWARPALLVLLVGTGV
ncbi:MAG: hypothetical protein HOQ22_13140, partial [Nocardioidaceae bacterium]|nr:hypothetical protein [Nocardioidaceae bacterium]